ncbi:unnamed protein product [Mesocestoides corti]|uniref:Uncharacterized protein n=1 Tax=Mesocestoides corti TaxID=53468 RepID=A0A0R3UHI2_MESCO|nr:unnamed protein product [Mesocestoides corti]
MWGDGDSQVIGCAAVVHPPTSTMFLSKSSNSTRLHCNMDSAQSTVHSTTSERWGGNKDTRGLAPEAPITVAGGTVTHECLSQGVQELQCKSAVVQRTQKAFT